MSKLGTAILSLLIGAIGGWVALTTWLADPVADLNAESSATSALAQIEQFQCPRGLTKIVVMHGQEDEFAAGAVEPADIRPALLQYERYLELSQDRHGIFGFRDYDELGADKFLIDHFELPRGIVSGEIVTRLRELPGSKSDTITLGNYDPTAGPTPIRGEIEYQVDTLDPELRQFQPDAGGLITVDLTQLQHNTSKTDGPPTFIEYLNTRSRPDALDLIIQDDTAVDFFAFLLCQEPSEPKGTRLSEFDGNISEIGISYLSCAEDVTQPSCNPASGDRLCSLQTQIACYKDGARTPPNELKRENKYFASDDGFVGGEVRLSRPVRAGGLPTLDSANGFCAAEFGKDWRVLSFHEAIGSTVLSYSKIQPRDYGLVHIGDMPYGNCWDRPASVIRP